MVVDNIQTDRIFGDYIIKGKLGSGGMATVFRAVHSQSDQTVALKILHEHYADDENIRKRLEHEAQIAMRLSHPYIVPVWDYGVIDNRPYLVMPYLSGGSLAAWFQQPRSIKHETSLTILGMLATALDYAHAQQVVHRDFKLENILLDENRVPAISDFGIAQSAQTTRITITGQILGTPQYLAPENVDERGNLNYKADLYALAVMAYVMFTGYFPFTAHDPVSLLVKHRTEIAPLASWVNGDLPTTLDRVFVRALAKSPKARFPSAESFIEALESAFLHSAIVTTTVRLNEQNPVSATVAAPMPEMPARKATGKTQVFEPEYFNKSASLSKPMPAKRDNRKFFALGLLMLLLCAGTSGVLFFFSMNPQGAEGAGAETTIDAAQAFLPQGLEDALLANGTDTNLASETASPSASPSPTVSPSPSHSPSPTMSPSPSNTRNPSHSPTPTLTPSRTPTTVPQSGGGGGQAPAPSNTRRPTATRTPIPTLTPTRVPSNTPVPTRVPSNTPVPTATNIPPTAIPPTAIPPTAIPPTAIPPTAIPPTAIPPTDPPPPTDVPPTDPPPPTNPPPPPPTDEPPPPPTDPPSEEGTGEG